MGFKNLKLFRILGVYSGFFAFIGSELADYTIFRLISRRFDEKRLLLFTDYILAVTQNDFGGRVWRGLEVADERPVYGCTSHLWNRAFCVLQAGSAHGVNPYPVSVIGILPLPESGGKDTKMTDMMNCVDKLLEKKA